MATYEELMQSAEQIRTNELPESNTHQLVGQHLKNQIEFSKNENDGLKTLIDNNKKEVDGKLTELDNKKLSISDLAQSTGGSTTTPMSQDATTKALSGLLTGQKASETPFITRYRSDSNGNLWDTFNSELNDMAKSEAAVINGLIKYYLSGLRVDVVNRVVDSSTGINRRLTQVVTGNLFVNDSGDLAFNGDLDRSYWRVYAKGVWSPWVPVVKDIVGIYPTTLDVRGLSGTATPAQIAELNKIKAAIDAWQLCVLGTDTAGSDPETLIISVTTTGNVSSGLTYYVKGISTKGIIYSASCTVTYDIWGGGDSYGNWQTGRTDLNALNTLGESITSPMSQDAVTKALSGLLTGQEADKSPFISLYRDGNGDQVWESLNREISDINTMATAKYNGLIRFYLSGLRVDVVNRVVDSSTGSRRLTQVVTGNLFVNDSGDLAFNGNVDQSFKRLYADGAWGAWTPLSSGGFAGVPEAPADGSTYGRKNKSWVKTIGRSGTGSSAETFNNTSNTASGNYSHAEGDATNASGHAAHAEGQKTKATGYASHAEGGSTEPAYQTHAAGKFAHAEGNRTHAAKDASHAEGYATTANGTCSHAEGNTTTASGEDSHAEGNATNAVGLYSHAEGQNSTAKGQAAHAEGNNTKTGECETYDSNYESISTSGNNYGHAEGNNTAAGGMSSHAEGEGSNAFGRASHSEGQSGAAIGLAAHSEGELTMACGEGSHSEGIYTQAGKAVKNGNDVTISGSAAHAEGFTTKALGDNSHAEGKNTIANNESEHAQGRFNASHTHASDTSQQTIDSVGIGTKEADRKNATETMANGDLYIYGIGGYNGKNPSEAKTVQAVISELLNKIQELESK